MSAALGPLRMGRGAALWLRVYRLVAWLTQPKYTIGSMVQVRRPDGAILLVRQRLRTPSLWTMPGGFKKRHESAAAAGAREVREETGVVLDLCETDRVAQYEQPWARHVDTVFSVRLDDRAAPARRMSVEIAEVGWFSPAELPPLTREAALALEHLARPS